MSTLLGANKFGHRTAASSRLFQRRLPKAISPSKNSPGPLPPTLFSIYRTYKRETSTVIGWLTSFDKTAENSKDDENPILRELTARQIADRARKAARMGTRPPKDIEAAFKMVIVNRSRLTKHYESLSSSSQSCQNSTENHKVFNETLAEMSCGCNRCIGYIG